MRPGFLFSSMVRTVGQGRGVLPVLRHSLGHVRSDALKRSDRSSFNKLFSSVSLTSPGLNGATSSGGALIDGMLLTLSSVSFKLRTSRRVSVLKSTCRCVVSRFTTKTKGGTKRFCAPRRIDHVLTRVISVKRRHLHGICSPAYNDNSLLLHTTDVKGTISVCKRRGGPAACGLTQVGVLLRNVEFDGFGVRGKSALR